MLGIEDPNPPHGIVHLWAAHGINPDRTELQEGVDAEEAGFRQALNGLGKPRYDGPEPPAERGVFERR